MNKILIVGEVLIDMVENHKAFNFSVGGAPFNVAYNISSLGNDVSFVGQVGDDYFGKYILDLVKDKQFFDCKIEMLKDKNTTIALNVEEKEGRTYHFLRKNTADFAYNLENLNKINIADYKIVHIGSLFLSSETGFEIIKSFIEKCKKNNVLVSFDVNLRQDIFASKEEILNRYQYFIDNADLLKMSDEETDFFFGKLDYISLATKFKDRIFIKTCGKEGATLYFDNRFFTRSSYTVKVKDTVGAGDSFYSGFLYQFVNTDLKNLSDIEILNVLKFASACGALTCATNGALNGYKSSKDVYDFMKKYESNKRFMFLKY